MSIKHCIFDDRGQRNNLPLCMLDDSGLWNSLRILNIVYFTIEESRIVSLCVLPHEYLIIGKNRIIVRFV